MSKPDPDRLHEVYLAIAQNKTFDDVYPLLHEKIALLLRDNAAYSHMLPEFFTQLAERAPAIVNSIGALAFAAANIKGISEGQKNYLLAFAGQLAGPAPTDASALQRIVDDYAPEDHKTEETADV